LRVLVITNVAAARARRHLPALRQALPESTSVRHCVTEQAAELGRLVGHDRWQPADLLVINGGDGSVQHVLTELLDRCPPGRLPRIACLPGGTTNMTAFDINEHRGFRACVETLVRAAGQVPGVTYSAGTAPRPVVRVFWDDDPSQRPRYGLFFGMGTIVQGIEYFHERVRPSGGGHELGAGVAMARAVWGIVRKQPPFAEPLHVELRAPGSTSAPACWEMLAVRLLLVTALDRLFLGMRPYWDAAPADGDRAGFLKGTWVESGATRFLLSMPRLLRGRPDGAMQPRHGYHSGRFDRLGLRFHGSFTLDGELIASSGDTITVHASAPVRFVPL
jgi:diacylglycerol kinase (ATP)